MRKLSVRLVFLSMAALSFAEAVLPQHVEHVRVSAHEIDSDSEITRYNLFFDSGRVHSCNVSPDIYRRVRDGDSLEVSSGAIAKECVGIAAEGHTLKSRPWRLISLGITALLLMGAFAPVRSRQRHPN
jgi:hypothetical protein